LVRNVFGSALAVVVAAILCAGVVTYLVHEFSPAQLGQWLRALAATSLSALFAIAVGIWLFNRQIRINDERRRQQLLQVLRAEIRDIRDVLTDTGPGASTSVLTASGTIWKVILPEGLELIAFDEAVRSGLLPTKVTVQVIYLAGAIRAYNARVHRAQAIIQAEIIAAKRILKKRTGYLLDRNVNNLEQHRRKEIKECDRILKTLEQLRTHT
jgi:uncharacterized protein